MLDIIFNNYNIRTLTTNKNEILFVGTDIAKALGYKNPREAIKYHCRKAVKMEMPHPQSKVKTILMNMIPEADVYRLIIKSELESAKRFEEWLLDEAIPEIIETGKYEMKGNMPVLNFEK